MSQSESGPVLPYVWLYRHYLLASRNSNDAKKPDLYFSIFNNVFKAIRYGFIWSIQKSVFVLYVYVAGIAEMPGVSTIA